jgi:hypothetical protein
MELETNQWRTQGHDLPQFAFVAGVKRFNQVTALQIDSGQSSCQSEKAS